MSDLTQIKQVLESSAGKQLKDYLIAKTLELRNIEAITEYQTSAAQTLEVKAQLRAYKKLKEIMQDIMIFETEVKTKNPEDSYEVY